MKARARYAALAALLSFAIAILLLNLREKDYYEGGSPVPPRGDNVPPEDGTFRRIVPETVAHPCPACGDCTHPVEILENTRVMRILDHDGWYRLFWAGDETYCYEEFPTFAAALRNSTARDPQGTWRIRARLGPPTHGTVPPHPCTLAPGEFSLEYALEVSRSPIAPGAPVRTDTPLSIPSALDWFSFLPDRPHLPYLLHFGWRLALPPAVPAVRCPCGKP